MKQELQFSQSVMDRFAKLRQKQKLAHAYLFIGPAFIGKKETALGVAKLLNCEQGDQINAFCDQCSSCLKINAGSHPDIHLIESDFGETIKIDQVRNLIAQAKLRPFEATKKIFIMQNIENLTVEGANALLKVLRSQQQVVC